MLFISFVINVSSCYKGESDLKFKWRKRTEEKFDVIPVMPQKNMPQFNYLIHSRSYLTFYSILMSFYKGKSLMAKRSFMTLPALRRTHLHVVRMVCASCNTRHWEPNTGREWMQAHLTPSQKPSPHSLKFLKVYPCHQCLSEMRKPGKPLMSSQKLRILQQFLIVTSERQRNVFRRGKTTCVIQSALIYLSV